MLLADRGHRSLQRQSLLFLSPAAFHRSISIAAKLLSFSAEREYIVTQLAKKAETDIGLDNIDVVAGGETAGIPYASFVSHLIKKPMIYIRKQPKGYGGTKQIEGILEPGKRVLLVEDLITDGLSKLRFNIGIRGGRREDDPLSLCLRLCFGSPEPARGQRQSGQKRYRPACARQLGRCARYRPEQELFYRNASKQIVEFLKDPENWGRKMGFV